MANHNNSSPALSNVTFQNNSTTFSGGGMYNSNGSSPTITDSRFIENHAGTSGGGMSNDGSSNPTITNSIFSNNTADVDGGQGGGMSNSNSSPVLSDVEFLNNRATSGGGMSNGASSAPQLTGVTFTGNLAELDDENVGGIGGGMWNVQSSPTLVNVSFKDNSADGSGGGIFNLIGSSATLINAIMSGNTANSGAAINNSTNSSVELTNVTITGNTAAAGGGGIVNFDNSSSTLTNTIVWGNTGNNNGNQIWNGDNSTATLYYSLYGNEANDIVVDAGFTAENSITSNPAFESTDPENDDFLRLSESSPAIDAGDPDTDLSLFPGGPTDPEDLAGNPRVFNLAGGGIIDIGSFEFQGESDGPEDPEVPEFVPFITTWKTNNPGDSNDNQIRIPLIGNGYEFTVDWGDDNGLQDYSPNESDGVVHYLEYTYADPGIYTVSISGYFPRIYFFNADDREKILTVEQWGDIAWSSMERAFNGATNLNITAEDAPDLSAVGSMRQIFNLASSLNADLNNWNTATITDMSMAFRRATDFNGNISGWQTGNVTDMTDMFIEAENFNGNIGGWDVGEVTNMAGMFRDAKAFNGDISGWNTAKVTTLNNMFRDASSFDHSLGGWNIAAVSNMNNMLNNSGLSTENYDATLMGWATFVDENNGPENIVIGAEGLFYCTGTDARQFLINTYDWTFIDDDISGTCEQFLPFITTWQVEEGDLQISIPMIGGGYDFTIDWGDSSEDTYSNNPAEDVEHSLSHTYSEPGKYDVSISGHFPRIYINQSDDRDKIIDVVQWGDIEWASMNRAFYGASNLNISAEDAPDLSGVENMGWMFRSATNLNSPIGHWDTSNITRMDRVFRGATSFNQPLDGWTTNQVTTMAGMFYEAREFNQDLNHWNTEKVTDMNQMFRDADEFDGDITEWETGQVENFNQMFRHSKKFNQPIGGWDTGSATNMGDMFFEAIAFNQDVSQWDISKVTSLSRMFSGATSFNQSLGGWDISHLSGNMTNLLNNTALSIENYDDTLIEWAKLEVQSGVTLGAEGLQYCEGEEAREILTGELNNWTIIDAGRSDSCVKAPEGEDRRVLALNNAMYIFSSSDFGLSTGQSIKIISLPARRDINRNVNDVLSIAQLNNGGLTYDSESGDYGYGYDSFEFSILDSQDTESEESYTMAIDLASTFVTLTGQEGWRFISPPTVGETVGSLFSSVWTQGFPGSNNPGATFNNVYQADYSIYDWAPATSGSTPVNPGLGTIIYVYENDNNSSSFPKTISISNENFFPYDEGVFWTGLFYDASQNDEDVTYFLLGNTTPFGLDFCEFTRTNVADNITIWDPNTNSGAYVTLL